MKIYDSMKIYSMKALSVRCFTCASDSLYIFLSVRRAQCPGVAFTELNCAFWMAIIIEAHPRIIHLWWRHSCL